MDRDVLGVPEKIFLRFQNAGNTHLVPRGIVTVRDSLDRVVRRSVLNEDSGRILPESFRMYTVSLKNGVPAFLPGKYVISVEYRYDGSDEFSVTPTQTFFSLPLIFLWIVAAILGMFLAIFLAKTFRAFLFRKKRKPSAS